MIRFVTAFAALALAASPAAAQKLDKNGKCHGPDGKFAKMEVCKSTPQPKQTCKDAKGKFAKCGAPGAVPVAPKK